MDNSQVFRDLDEQERLYAPEQLPAEEQRRVLADEGATHTAPNEPPSAAPVANLGNAPSAAMAPPNIGHEDRGGAPGAPNPQARDPRNKDE